MRTGVLDQNSPEFPLRHIGNLLDITNPTLSLKFVGSMEHFARVQQSAGRDPRSLLDHPDTKRLVTPIRIGPAAVTGKQSGNPPRTEAEEHLIRLAENRLLADFESYVTNHIELLRPDVPTRRPWVPLHLAAWLNLDSLITFICATGIPVDLCPNPLGMTALYWAACNGSGAAIDALLRHGAKIAQTNYFTWSAADLAHHNDHIFLTTKLAHLGCPPYGQSVRNLMASLETPQD